jgi:hypothetical protein
MAVGHCYDALMNEASSKSAVEFVWDGQDGLFELAYLLNQRTHYTKTEALDSLDGNRYFAPLARKVRGSKKKDVADTGNVLWADIDSLDGLEERLARLLPIRPGLVVFSGMKGFWIYLKLGEAIPTNEIEQLNRGLGLLLGADHCHNRDRIARLPGSIHQTSGKRAEVVEFSALVYTFGELAFLADLAPPPTDRALAANGDVPSLVTTFPSEFPALGDEIWRYIDRSPRRGEGYDRSQMEHKIFTALAYQGWTDEEIVTFANHYRLPRHLQEWARHKNYSWTERSFRKARQWIEDHPPSPTTHISNGMCIGSETKGSYSHADRHKALRLVTGSQTTKDVIHDFRTELPNKPSKSTAYRMLKQFNEAGLIQKVGRVWKLTERGRHYTDTKFDFLMPLPKIRPEHAA